MAEPTKQSCPTSRLLDLPNDIIESIIGPTAADRKAFMAVCRKAGRVILLSSDVTVKITEHTKLPGIKKVLDSFPAHDHLEIICPADQDLQPNHDSHLSALAVFTGMAPNDSMTQLASRWEGITKVTIKGTLLRSLVPQFIALTCPQLKQLKIVKPAADTRNLFTNDAMAALPFGLCSSLTQLHLHHDRKPGARDPTAIELPPVYHTVPELWRNLPNIDTLVMTYPSIVLIEAFAAQLTRLEIGHLSRASVEPIRQCSRLKHLSMKKPSWSDEVLLDRLILPKSTIFLRTLEYTYAKCSDDDIRRLLEMPSLSVLRLRGFKDIQQDWSGHACSWQELHIEDMGEFTEDAFFTTFGNLSMSSLKKLTVTPEVDIRLPDPSDPDSRAAVQRAVDNFSHVGQITLEDSFLHADVAFGNSGTIAWFGRRGTLPWDLDNNDEAAAELISIAAQRIGPVKICDIYYLMGLPLCLRAVFDWGATFIESVCVGPNYELEPHVWQALQRLQKLSTVVIWADEDEIHKTVAETISSVASDAAQHYVIPANRSLRMEFGRLEWFSDGVEEISEETYSNLRAAISQDLPAGSRLASAKYCSEDECGPFRCYGGESHCNAYWVIVVEPSLSSLTQSASFVVVD